MKSRLLSSPLLSHTNILCDQFLPELWATVADEEPRWPHLGVLGGLRYRTIGNLTSSRSGAMVGRSTYEETCAMAAESSLRVLNAALVTSSLDENNSLVSDSLTPPLLRSLHASTYSCTGKQQLPLCRIVKLLAPPQVRQTRVFAIGPKQEMFAQVTLRVVSLQQPVNSGRSKVFRVPFANRNVWLPYAVGLTGLRFNFFREGDTVAKAEMSPSMRFSPLPLMVPGRGTFGSLGRTLTPRNDENDEIRVENHVVLEKSMGNATAWRLHHF